MNLATVVLINSICFSAVIIAFFVQRRKIKELDESVYRLALRGTTQVHNEEFNVDVLADHKLLSRLLKAKRAYCMDYNKENGLYCTHAKDHKSWNMFSTGIVKHKTHHNGGVRWAMKEKKS